GQHRLPLFGNALNPAVVDLGPGPHPLTALAELGDGGVVVDLAGRAAGDESAGDAGVGQVAVAVGVAVDDPGNVGELDRNVAQVASALLRPEVDAVASGTAREGVRDRVGF